ncbi:glycoside hydrolase family 5 protein [Dacryopinax primogenitus]|uniref:glucan 1,3-beta-glucosidase n=1 Tax=Dacryopinax primogenitus (strain DJM 731) TaxID=1858805 RepID=M5GF55_DACPD|nr:glycoside hydrolase family 5 protein [Dacryopinax primogenitus]EJU03858.1 glycoside hydrolase family 5 protein [Dacryopinax primogenitus]
MRISLFSYALLASTALAVPCCTLRKKGSLRPSPPGDASPASSSSASSASASPASSASASPAPSPANTTSTPSRHSGFAYGSTPVRGVNLGGWLVLEPWITPSIFDNTGNDGIVDEWTLGQYSDYDTALNTLRNHWSSWITKSDMQQIAAAGLNHVRIPIGFWAFDNSGTPYIMDQQYSYLKQAVQWASASGISVWVDLHGVPGSQNGYDNSGQRGTPTWHTEQSNVQRSQAIIQTLANEFSQGQYGGAVTAIELVNEPAGYYSEDLLTCARNYYGSTYTTVRNAGNLVVVLHDAFQSLDYWNGFLTSNTGASNVLMDTHIYQVFNTDQLQESWQGHINDACSNGARLASFAEQNLWTVVGEWSTASTDCAVNLNGRGVGARYDGTYPGSSYIGNCYGQTGDQSTFSADYKTFLRQFWEAQVTAYEQAQGWIYWCWKNEQADDWSYQKGVQNGWIPSNPNNRQYPNICG